MKLDKYILFAAWIGMYIMCAVLGFLPPQEGANKWLLVVIALLFFVPPALLVYQGWKQKKDQQMKIVQRISLIVVIATVTMLVFNLLSVALIIVMPEETALVLGDVLYDLLILVSTPMLCGQYWGIGLVGWVVLMWCCISLRQMLKKEK